VPPKPKKSATVLHPAPIFAPQTFFMAQDQLHLPEDDREFGKNWVTTSRFMFYMQVVALAAFMAGCSGFLYSYRYKGKPKVAVPESTQYTPKYKV
jgi:hypothetical protein